METENVSQQIINLEQEILEIQDVIKEKQKEKQLREAWRSLQGSSGDGQHQKNRAPNTEDYRHQLSLLERLTNVEFTRTDAEILGQGKFWLTKLSSIEGNCMGEEFKLQLEIKEIMNEDASVTSEIIGFTVEYLTVKHKQMLKHINLLKEEKNVQAFFMLLRSYTKWCKLRTATFEHFLTTYPQIASQVTEQCLQLQHLNKHCVFKIDWSLGISSSHLCYPDINLSVQIKPVSKNNDLLIKAPDMFQLMLKELGIEKSINSIVTLCSD